MAHPVPVVASVQSGQAPLDDLRMDLFMVTQDGAVAKDLGGFPVTGGVAQLPDVPLADPALRWAIRVVDVRLNAPVYRSGPLGRLPGGGSVIFPDRIRIHRGGGHLGLDGPDGAPQALTDFVRDHLPSGFTMQGIDLAADDLGRYQLTFRGLYAPLPFGQAQVSYRRAFGIAPGLDPGRARRVAVAWPQGAASGGLPWIGAFLELDAVLAAGVEAQMTAMAGHIGWLMLVAAGVTDLTPQTVSMTSVALGQEGQEVGCSVVLTAGALAGGIVFQPVPPIVLA
jgi:hypothetical protein